MAAAGEIMNELSRKARLLERLHEVSGENGEGAKRSLGQNFLISEHVIERILFAVRSLPFSELVEVGPGLGAITEDLLLLDKPLTVIELDRRFAEYWRSRSEKSVGPAPRRVIEADALRVDWRDLGFSQESLFVSNLPYQISSRLVIERSLEPAGITRMILMFQKEVAQRIAARAGTKEYGLLTVIAQTFWEIQTVCDAGPQAFFPPPNVSSRVLQFRRRRTGLDWLASGEGSAKGFLGFVKAAYSHRRKLLLRNLEGSYFGGDRTLTPRLQEIFAAQGLLSTARAEELDPEAMVRLYLTIEKAGLHV